MCQDPENFKGSNATNGMAAKQKEATQSEAKVSDGIAVRW